MKTDLRLRCRCGKFRAVVRDVSGSAGNRLICYCDDCQAFAKYLGRGDDALDAHGGTDIFQVSQAQLRIEEGAEQLACVRLRPGGLFRWYTACCGTPVGNTLPTHKIPFIGLIHACWDTEGRPVDDVIGPVRAGVHGAFATGDRSAIDAHDKASPGILLRIFSKLAWWRLRGDHKRTPLFDAGGNPVATPVVRQ